MVAKCVCCLTLGFPGNQKAFWLLLNQRSDGFRYPETDHEGYVITSLIRKDRIVDFCLHRTKGQPPNEGELHYFVTDCCRWLRYSNEHCAEVADLLSLLLDWAQHFELQIPPNIVEDIGRVSARLKGGMEPPDALKEAGMNASVIEAFVEAVIGHTLVKCRFI